MATNPPPASSEGAEATSVVNDAWYLHSSGRRFGPLTEDELHGYFRAGMVKAGDEIAIAGQSGTTSAMEVARLLNESPPLPSATSGNPLPAPMPSAAAMMDKQSEGVAWSTLLGALLAVFGLAYLGFSGRLTPHRKSTEMATVLAPTQVVENGAVPAASQEQADPFTGGPTASGPILPPAPVDNGVPSVAQPAATTHAAAESTTAQTDVAPQGATDVWYAQASQLASASNWPGLAAHCQKWVVVEPSRDLSWWYLGIAQSRLGNLPEAIDALKHALSIDPRNFDARSELAHVYMQSNQYREAVEIYNALVQEQPDNATLWINLGIATAELGEYDESVAALDKATKVEPRNRYAWYHLGRTYSHFGYLDKAKDAYDKMNAIR